MLTIDATSYTEQPAELVEVLTDRIGAVVIATCEAPASGDVLQMVSGILTSIALDHNRGRHKTITLRFDGGMTFSVDSSQFNCTTLKTLQA